MANNEKFKNMFEREKQKIDEELELKLKEIISKFSDNFID